MAERRVDDAGAEQLAIEAAVTEFVSQLNVDQPDEVPVLPWAPVESGRAVRVQPGPTEFVTHAPGTPAPITDFTPSLVRSNGGQPPPPAALKQSWSVSVPTWWPQPSLVGVLLAVAIVGWAAVGIVSWLAVGRRAQATISRELVVQTKPPAPPVQTKPLAPPVQTQQPPRSAARTRERVQAVARAPVQAPIVTPRPARRAAAEPRPLSATVVDPELRALSFATLKGPSVVPSVSEPVPAPPEPGAIILPRIVYQEVPRPLTVIDQPVSVLLVILITADGRVERAFIGSMPVLPQYEQQLLTAAKMWRYTPAFQNGRAIPYRKTLRVTVPASRGRR
jgi:hypothetical protein